ncbi:Chaperone protein DnaK [Diplonema papillatum]|nr:Chaperone protein DnaK [Diplonema papillatum]
MAALPCTGELGAVTSPALFSRVAAAAAQAAGDAAIGIDLGTKNSVVAVLQAESGKAGGGAEAEHVRIIPCDGHPTTPSVVYYSPDGSRLVGRAAVARQVQSPASTVYDVKRLIGRSFDDPEISKWQRTLPYDIVKHASGRAAVALPGGKVVESEAVSAAILAHLKQAAEKSLGRKVTKAVITVPAYFNDSQRASTKAAGEIAGLQVLRVISEPTAAAIAHGFGSLDGATADGRKGEKKSTRGDRRNVLVFDIGGGTFDVSLLAVKGGFMEVLTTAGDTKLGGQDIDMALLDHVVGRFKKSYSIDLRRNKQAMEHLRQACISTKHALSDATTATTRVTVPRTPPGLPPLPRPRSLLREFWRKTSPKRGWKCVVPRWFAAEPALAAKIALRGGGDAGGEEGAFDVTVTRRLLEVLAGPTLQRCRAPLDAVLRDARVKRAQVDDILLVGGVTRMPMIRKFVSSYFGRNLLSDRPVDPDSAVATGAAIQAAKLTGVGRRTRDMLLLDVAPLTTGIETQGGFVTPVIKRNTPIPARQTKVFTTTQDSQEAVDIRVHQGERPRAKDNYLLGQFSLRGIPPAERGVPKIDVTFDIDANGILNVKAKDAATQKTSGITIHSTKALSPEDVDRMILDSKANAAADRKAAEARDKVESLRELIQRSKTSASALSKSHSDSVLSSVQSAESWLASRETAGTLSAREVTTKHQWLDRELAQAMRKVYKT